MKIKSVKINTRGLTPIKKFFIEDMGNFIIFAGANGSGKTRLMNEISRSAAQSRESEEESHRGAGGVEGVIRESYP